MEEEEKAESGGAGEEKTGAAEKEPESVAPAQEKQAEPVKQAKTEREGPSLGSRIKNWIIIILLLMILIPSGTYWMWKSGVKDLKGDNTFLIVVQDQGVAKAGSIYDLSANKAEVINVEELPAVTDLGLFYREASKKKKIDRLIVIRVRTVTELSTDPFLEYGGHQLPSDDIGGYITGSYWDADLAGSDPPWMFRAKLLSNWIEHYSDKIKDASFGSQVYTTLFDEYRSGGVVVYPRNRALLIIKYVPLEKILL
ncbi:MAG: hypothetical protein D6733_05160 [Methanobacteriota archaeon]|nr:MAG: hypothetical protein D6733_05160 [Euryarchaeota archaeon]